MYAKTVTYVDYNGVERTETFYFNLSKAELSEMELTKDGGMANALTKLTKEKNFPEITKVFKDLLLKSYGEKTPDGKHFIKDLERSKMFTYTPAYDQIYCELITNTDAAIAFANGIMPPDIAVQVKMAQIKEEANNLSVLPDA